MKKTKVLFLIIGFNSYDLVQDCVANFTSFVDSNSTVVLFDNGSKPSLKGIAQKQRIPYFRSEKNLGFSDGVNTAVRHFQEEYDAEWIALVNSDVFITKEFPHQLEEALLKVNKQNIAAWQPTLYQDNSYTTLENRGIRYLRSGIAWQNRKKDSPSTALNGAFLFLKKSTVTELFQKDGYIFIPYYFFNAEDVELSLRLAGRGKKLALVSSCEAQHLGSQSSSQISNFSYFYYVRNLVLTIFLQWPLLWIVRYLPFIILGQVFLLLYSMKGKRTFVYGKALWQLWRDRKMLADLRRHMQQERTQKNSPRKEILVLE